MAGEPAGSCEVHVSSWDKTPLAAAGWESGAGAGTAKPAGWAFLRFGASRAEDW